MEMEGTRVWTSARGWSVNGWMQTRGRWGCAGRRRNRGGTLEVSGDGDKAPLRSRSISPRKEEQVKGQEKE